MTKRRQGGRGLELPVVAGWVFTGAGAVMVAGGVALAFDEPGGIALAVFGLVFVGVGSLARKVFATPKGKRAVVVSSHDVGIENVDGTRGRRRQGTIIHVDEDASEAEVEAAKQAWLQRQWERRPDWVSGRVQAEDQRLRGQSRLAAILWTVFALGGVVAGLVWGGMAWLVAGLAGAVAAALIVLAIRATLRERRFGASVFVMNETPARLGQRLTGEVDCGVPTAEAPPGGFSVRLRCVHLWEETDRSGSNDSRRTLVHRDVLWAEEATASVRPHGDRLTLSVDIPLPADQPGTTLGGGQEGIVWELEVSAPLEGIDFLAEFQLPVLASDPSQS